MSKKILVIAAHPDDEVLGCGATIAKHVSMGDIVQCIFMTNGESSREKKLQNIDLRKSAVIKVSQFFDCLVPIQFDFPDNKMDSVPLIDIAKKIEKVSFEFNPNVIYTHSASDLNIDHRLTLEASLVAFRPQPNSLVKKILSFEIPSATNWAPKVTKPFNPNYFVDCSKFVNKKIKALGYYDTEIRDPPHARSLSSIESRMTFYGSNIGVNAAEAFEVVRFIDTD